MSRFSLTRSYLRAYTVRHVHLRALFGALAILLCCAALLAFVQYGTASLADNDGFYHMRMAQMMRSDGLTPPFPWLPLTILNDGDFYNHHLLYHIYLGFFAGDGSDAALISGTKVASILMPALAFTAIWWLLRGAEVPWAWAWAIGLCAVSEAFLYRMSLPRAQSASLLVLVLALHWLLRRRYALLVPLGFLYVWLYNAFPLLILVALIVVAAGFMTERRLEWRALIYPAAGIVLGLIINPYFPQNLIFIISHLVPKFGELEVSVGNEWYPYRTWTLVENSGGALALWLLGVFALGWRGRRFDRATLAAFALSVAFGLMLFKSRRFVEYFPPFALIFAALSSGPLLKEWLAGSQRFLRRAVPALLLAILIATLTLTLLSARLQIANARPAATYADASAWLHTNAPTGSRIFNTDWDDFPRLFFYNTSATYIVGLDPTYLQLADPARYDTWVQITRGDVAAPGAIIREQFGATFVITDLRHGDFLRRAAADAHMHERYRDQYAVIFEIR
ncbi:MAG TPA: hypothetical protein PKA05_15995 [Roseiflexaceae bacterium]|nr:hypothetical protein [Roseiflexaceae bacterium]HMP41883.1 hypothetical protein [Roseiflexaceae bacterium]